MGMENYSRFQQQAIKNFYNNRESIAYQRLGELVTELYLAEGKKRQKLWEQITGHLEKLSVPPDQIAHLTSSDKPELLAQFLSRKA